MQDRFYNGFVEGKIVERENVRETEGFSVRERERGDAKSKNKKRETRAIFGHRLHKGLLCLYLSSVFQRTRDYKSY